VARAILVAAQRDLDTVYVPGWLRFPACLAARHLAAYVPLASAQVRLTTPVAPGVSQ
jgi:hypothetical protein